MTKVKLIAITQPLINNEKNEKMSADEFIAYCARVSNPANQNNSLTSPKLLKYCIKHKHWSVFETVSATLEIETTRDIARQMLRHRSFSFQEFSQRYADPTNELGFVTRETRLQDEKNRQNSIETDDSDIMDKWETYQGLVTDTAYDVYQWAIKNGIAKEQARVVLPEGLTMSRLYMAGTLRSWIHYIDVRNTPKETQKEHIEIAQICQDEIIKYFPSLQEYFEPQPTVTELHPQ